MALPLIPNLVYQLCNFTIESNLVHSLPSYKGCSAGCSASARNLLNSYESLSQLLSKLLCAASQISTISDAAKFSSEEEEEEGNVLPIDDLEVTLSPCQIQSTYPLLKPFS